MPARPNDDSVVRAPRSGADRDREEEQEQLSREYSYAMGSRCSPPGIHGCRTTALQPRADGSVVSFLTTLTSARTDNAVLEIQL
jgi:hypothetical protein